MARNIRLAATGTEDSLGSSEGHRVIDLDLTDEHGLLCQDYAERHPDGTRALLAALNLQPGGHQADEPVGRVFDLGIYRATGSRRLASILGHLL